MIVAPDQVSFAPEYTLLVRGSTSLEDLQGRQIQLEIVDDNTGGAFAWIGLQRVSLTRLQP